MGGASDGLAGSSSLRRILMNINEQIQLWNQVIVRVLDIRIKRVGHGDEIRDYVAPTSMFMYLANGSAELWADGDVWLAERFHLQHIGKGKRVSVQSASSLDAYMILYKASLPASALWEFHMMMQTENPFMESWGLAPSEPLVLLEMLQAMVDDWKQADGGGRGQCDQEKSSGKDDGLRWLKAKGDFIRFTHAALRERAEHPCVPSLAEQVIRYMARNYRGVISVEQLAQQMNYTPQYVSRKFKEQMGCSPLEYAIRLRMDMAHNLLRDTAATQQEIAAYVGYPDVIYFNRVFKKQTGVTPGQYRQKYRDAVSKDTRNRSNSSVVAPHPAMYHVDNNDIHYHLLSDGGNDMASSKRKWLATALLCLTMAASGCETAPEGTGGKNNSATNQTANNTGDPSQAETKAPTTAEKRTITAATGEVEVPAQPKRVAAQAFLGTVLALGVQPVASETFLMNSPYLEGKLDGVTDVGDSLEALLEVEPDLIITQIAQAETVDKYAKIAPTVAMPYNRFASIQEEMRYFGDLLDKKDVAEQWIADFERKTGKLREAVQGALHEGETVSVMQEYDGTVFLFGPKSGRGGRIMYEILGAKPPAAIPEHMLADSYYEFSLEKLPEYTGDYLILTTNSTLEQLKADPIWGKLPPIRDGKVFLWNENQSWYRDPIAVEGQINSLAEWITKAAKK
ncbi:AraC family transcriptional regulator [Brevibacillus parabrevis]|uniref:AraC family transcriptional regulator n=1 Tax=Brevibacillus parabrevis TaxID=54914 RepID=UPI00237FDA75|nr:AraC family transcriptional regulator [Brevibacillus parabrevis]MED2256580.1 AraC family transcriptional regulator [Brevibacillus parabrevis]WDV96689.1 AraC family transcriptional regulator [Brevibacillus parabrevis]